MPVAEIDDQVPGIIKGTGTKDIFTCGRLDAFFCQFFVEVLRQLFSKESQCKDTFPELQSIALNFS